MDVNNSRYFLLRSESEFDHNSTRMHWHAARHALTLAQNQPLRLPASDAAVALDAWESATPMAVDAWYQVARLNTDATQVEFNSGRGWLTLSDDQLQDVIATDGTFRDLSLNREGRLALPWSNDADQHGLMLFHLRKRWMTTCSLPEAPRRAWADGQNRIWCISAGQLMLCEGQPLPLPYNPLDERFEPLTVNPGALSLRWQQTLPEGWEALALCGDNIESGDDEHLYILVHDNNGQQRILSRPLLSIANRPFTVFAMAEDVPFAIDLALVSTGRLAALCPREASDTAFRNRDCPVLELHLPSDVDEEEEEEVGGVGEARLIRERYPMLSLAIPRFASSADGQLRYQAETDPDYPDFEVRPRELHALRQTSFHLSANTSLTQYLDSGSPNTLWHRIYLDACIPPGCSIGISARVFDTPEERTEVDFIEQPAPVWNPLPSELAYQQPLSGYEKDRKGLFELLLQRPEGPVRRLAGRYLQIRVHLGGNARTTPALHALRVYYPRFSYQEAYLPELYRQELSFDPENSTGPANGADARERLLASFEGMLTPIEGRIAASDQLVHPDSAPRDTLQWLSGSIGANLPPHWPEARQRRWLKHATLIQQYKGTLAGTNLALDLVTDGGVQRGEVVLLENFRLRRTMATILGRNMDDAEHPLTLGTGMTGNSIVGDSLILSDGDAMEFLALLAPELATEKEAEAVKAFFNRYAHKLSLLLHGRGRQHRHAVEETLKEHLPAHLQYTIIETDRPFVLGTSPLLAIDTFVETPPAPEPVILDETLLGIEGLLTNATAFSPQDINASL